GDAAMTAWPRCRRLFTSLLPISPVPPMTTIFMLISLGNTDSAWATELTQHPGQEPASLLRFREAEALHVPRVQGPRHHPALHVARVLRHPVQTPGRLVERLARLEDLGR